MPRGRRLIGVLFLLLSFILAGLILTDALPILRGPAPETSEWYWPYLLRPLDGWWPALLAGTLLILVGGWWLRREEERAGLPLLILVVVNLALQLGLIYADRPNIGAELVDRTLSKASNGYLATAGEIDDLNEALRHFPDLMPTFDNDHARTHPPGFIAAHWLTDHALREFPAVADILARPATYWRCTDLWVLSRSPSTAASLFIWAWIPPLLAALTVIPGYRLSRRWFDPLPARLATLLVATLPALLVFVPTPDQIFACLSLLSLLWLVAGLEEKRSATVLLSGLVVSLMSFLSLGNVAWGALLGGYILWWMLANWSKRGDSLTGARFWALPALFVTGAAVFWMVYWVGWGVAPWTIARVGLAQHYELVTSLRRYDWWLASNLVDFLIFAGPPVVVGLFWRAVSVIRRPRDRHADDGRITILLVLLLLVINLAGSTRGEVGRLWLVFMPTAAVVAGGVFGNRFNDRRSVWLLLVAQVVLVLSVGLAWRSLYAVILPVQRPVLGAAVPSSRTDLAFAVTADQAIRLTGYDLPLSTVGPGDVIDLTLYWQSHEPTLRPYTIFVQLLDTSGAIIAQQDRWPVDSQWPTTCWASGEVVPDRYLIAIPPDAVPGTYSLVTGLYDAVSGSRLRLTDGIDNFPVAEILVGP